MIVEGFLKSFLCVELITSELCVSKHIKSSRNGVLVAMIFTSKKVNNLALFITASAFIVPLFYAISILAFANPMLSKSGMHTWRRVETCLCGGCQEATGSNLMVLEVHCDLSMKFHHGMRFNRVFPHHSRQTPLKVGLYALSSGNVSNTE